MKFIPKLSLLVFIGIAFISCENEDEVGIPDNTPNLKSISFIYEGVTYSSTYEFDKDSLMVFDNNEVEVLYARLDSMPELATYVHSNGMVEYFDNSELAQAKMGGNSIDMNTPKLRVSASGSISLFEHENMGGKSVGYSFVYSAVAPYFGVSVPFLEKYYPIPAAVTYVNFNDMTSSFSVNLSGAYRQCNVTLYEHKNYGGKSLSFTFYYPNSPFKINNLGDYKIKNGSLFSHSKSWHDQASSLKVSVSD